MDSAKERVPRPLTYIVLTSLVWIILVVVLLFLWPPGYRYKREIERLEYWYKIARLYSEIQANLIAFRFDEALRNTARLARLHGPPRDYIEASLLSFWYAVGTCGFVPSVSAESAAGVSEDDISKALENTVMHDFFTSHMIKVENLLPVIDNVFYENTRKNNLYALIAGFAERHHPEKAKEIYQSLAKLSEPEFQSLRLSAKTEILAASGDYQGIIRLRSKVLPEVKGDLSLEEEELLVFEVYAHVKLGENEKARELAKRYLDMHVLKFPNMREQLKIVAGIEKYPGPKSDKEFLEEIKQELMQLYGQQ
jgi:hypothetical protein